MVLMLKCKPSLCVLDTEIKSCYTRLGGNFVLKVTYFVDNEVDHGQTKFCQLPPWSNPSAFDFFLLKVN